MTRADKSSLLRQIPAKWALALVAALIVYAIAQPFANERFGLSLPSAISLLGEDDGAASGSKSTAQSPEATSPDAKLPSGSENSQSAEAPDSQQASGTSSSVSGEGSSNSQLRYGLLQETARDDYLSPAGLRYTPMSGDENHRLEHIARHLIDQPQRPVHGVFDGDMPQVLRWLDEAYTRAKVGAKGVSKKSERGREVYEISFSKPIGYIGGQKGKRQNHPDAKNVRIVLEGNRVITAFPF